MKLDCTTNSYAQLYAKWLTDPGKLLDLAELKPGERVLDLCGGTGVVAQEAVKRGAVHAFVADLNPRIAASGKITPIVARAESIDVSMRFVEDYYATMQDVDTISTGDDLDRPFDLVVCRQAIAYLDLSATARAVARVLRPGGRFAFNAFQKPRFAFKSYEFEGKRFFELSGYFGRTVMHVQAAPSIGVDVTKFRWYTPDEFEAALRPHFEISKIDRNRTQYYVCTKPLTSRE